MKKYFLFLVTLILLASCKDDSNNGGEDVIWDFKFYPRKVSYLRIVPFRQVKKPILGADGEVANYYTDYEGVRDGSVSKNLLYLNINTRNCNPDTLKDLSLYFTMLLDDRIPEIERQIGQDFLKNENQKNKNKSMKSGMVATSLIRVDLEYRITPVRNLTISALNTSLFGKPAGASLNDFFDITEYDPPTIISYPSNSMVYGYTSKTYPKAIGEWLSINPYGQPAMRLAPNRPITGLPLDVQFVIRMETGDGLILSDTTQVFTITE